MLKLLTSLSIPSLLILALPRACERKIGEDENGMPTQPTSTSPPIPTPPPVISAAPLSDFLPDGGGNDTLDQAKKYEANGQYWLARLLIEPLALGDDPRQEEVLLLARVCDKQEDDPCVERCNARLPKNLQLSISKRDGGRGIAVAPPPRPDDNTDFGRAQKLLLGGKAKDARAILEPKVLSGKSSSDETRLLREVCKTQGDKMCIALCNSKLGGR
jgi:hypothetical protein